jgi:hypothetical protein
MAGLVDFIEYRGDLLSVFGIWVRVPSGVDQRKVFGTQLFLAIGLGLSLIALMMPTTFCTN